MQLNGTGKELHNTLFVILQTTPLWQLIYMLIDGTSLNEANTTELTSVAPEGHLEAENVTLNVSCSHGCLHTQSSKSVMWWKSPISSIARSRHAPVTSLFGVLLYISNGSAKAVVKTAYTGKNICSFRIKAHGFIFLNIMPPWLTHRPLL